MRFFGLVDLISDVLLGPSDPPPTYPKAKPGPTPPPILGVIMQVCPFCRIPVIYYEADKRLCIHGPGPMNQTVCPGSGPNPRWKSMQG